MAFTLTQPLYGQGGSYTAQQDRLMLKAAMVTQGVRKLTAASGGVMTGDLAVTTTGTGNGSVSVASGEVVVASSTANQGFYFAVNDAATVVGSFAANSSGNPRIDLVTVQITDTGATPSVAFAIVQGTAAASPVAPATPSNALALAQVTIPNGFTVSTTVAAGNIVDVRAKAFLPDLSVQATPSVTGTIATQVPSPTDGNLVYSSVGKHLVAYNASTAAFEQVPSTAGFRNIIINGNFDVWQRATSQTVDGYNSADRFYVQTSALTTSQQTTGAPPGSRYVMRCASTSAGAYGGPIQMIETNNAKLLWGKQATASIKLRRNGTLSSSLVVSVYKNSTADASLGTAGWTLVSSVTVPTSSLPTGTTSADWYTAQFTFAVPQDGTANSLRMGVAWNTAAVASGEYYEVSQMQLEAGAFASPFEQRSYGQELALCQRYYEKSYALATTPGSAATPGLVQFCGTTDSGNNQVITIYMAVPKRVTSYTISTWDLNGVANQWRYARNGAGGYSTTTADLASEKQFRLYCSAGAAWVVSNIDGHWAVSAEL